MIRFFGLPIIFALLFFAKSYAIQANEIPAYSTLERQCVVTLNKDYSVSTQIIQSTLILDPQGREHGNINLPYDQFTKIENFEATLINPLTGKTIKKIKLKDLQDVSRISDNDIYNDSRIKYFVLGSVPLPVKVEVVMKIKRQGNFYFPDWYPVPFYHQKVTKTSLELSYPKALGMRYKAHHFASQPVLSESVENEILKWEESDLDVQEKKQKIDDPYLELAPVKFSMEGYAATLDSWEGLANWMNLLNKDRDKIAPAFRSEILKMVEGIDDPFEKIKILYQYLQKNYRYVSIQLGIGGWRSMKAEEVAKARYGDCKGLSMLMKTMLKEVGIDSQYTLVKAGAEVDNIDVEFPSNQFNHVILRIPTENEADPLWLECTSTTLPAGYLGNGTKNRNVLVITEEGGFIDKTPAYDDLSFNTILADFEIDLKANGDADIAGKSSFIGNPAVDFATVQYQLDEEEKKRYFNQKIGGNGLLVMNYNLILGQNKEVATADISFEGLVQRFSQSTTKRIIIPLNWRKIDEEMLTANSLLLKENFSVKTGMNLEPEILPEMSSEEDYFSLKVEIQEAAGVISIQKVLEIHLPEELSKTEKSDAIQKINTQLNKNLIFKKLD